MGRDLPNDLSRVFDADRRTLRRSRLTNGAWHLEGEATALVRDKVCSTPVTLGETYRAPLREILTGLNEALIINAVTRDSIVRSEPNSNELIRPFLRGENIAKWGIESEDLWLINIEFGWTSARLAAGKPNLDESGAWKLFSDEHPLLAAQLAPFSAKAKIRLDRGQYWWELRACAYYESFVRDKIIYPVFRKGQNLLLIRAVTFSTINVL